MPVNEKDCACFEKAKERGQHTFTLVAQDYTAPEAIIEWIKLNIETAPAEKLRCALEDALVMRDHSSRKHAD
jgi:hypothetical protein